MLRRFSLVLLLFALFPFRLFGQGQSTSSPSAKSCLATTGMVFSWSDMRVWVGFFELAQRLDALIGNDPMRRRSDLIPGPIAKKGI